MHPALAADALGGGAQARGQGLDLVPGEGRDLAEGAQAEAVELLLEHRPDAADALQIVALAVRLPRHGLERPCDRRARPRAQLGLELAALGGLLLQGGLELALAGLALLERGAALLARALGGA